MTESQPATQTSQLKDARSRLRDIFKDDSAPANSQRWDELWAAGDFLPWDRRVPNPALVDTLAERRAELGSPLVADGQQGRKRALVPGCGRGYDVLLLASAGYDATGVEVAPHAVEACEKMAGEVAAKLAAGEDVGDYATKDEETGRGKASFVVGDFFADDWVKKTTGSESGKFDLIYDYTFFCALPPAIRPRWALRTSQLLAPEGRLICLEFPTYKEPSTGGPPWGVAPVAYVQHLSRPGEEVEYNQDGYVVEEEQPRRNEHALVRIAHWQPKRTHEVGKGTDWVSIWRHV